MLAIIEELSEEISQNDIAELLTWYPHKKHLTTIRIFTRRIPSK